MARSNLFYRTISALVLIPLVLILIFYGNNFVILSVLTLFIFLSNYELFNLFHIEKTFDRIFGFLINIFFFFIIVYLDRFAINLLVIIFFIIVCYSLFLRGVDNFITYVSYYLFSIFYIPFLLSYVYKVFMLNNGRVWLLFLLLTNWVTDSFAYFAGISLGRHKFSKISPKKSIEGLAGGILGGILVGVSFNYFFFSGNNWYKFAILGFLGSIVGQISDLVESGIKRAVGVKDSSNIIPGHGGVLDRLDSLFFTAPLFYFFAINLKI